jgi:hypothetical protein
MLISPPNFEAERKLMLEPKCAKFITDKRSAHRVKPTTENPEPNVPTARTLMEDPR